MMNMRCACRSCVPSAFIVHPLLPPPPHRRTVHIHTVCLFLLFDCSVKHSCNLQSLLPLPASMSDMQHGRCAVGMRDAG